MSLFLSTLNQVSFLFGFIIIGYILAKWKILPETTATVLSKLENTVFIPALVMGTFTENFTVEKINAMWKLFAVSFIIVFIAIPIAILISRLVAKDKYIQKIYTYGLSFSNFGFMGNAVVMSLFPDVFFEYLIFTLPLWILIYLWGVPRLLIADAGKKQTFRQSVEAFINPMFIAMLIGMVIGLLNVNIPGWLKSIISVSGNCMSPIAMLLTGVVVSTISLKQTFSNMGVYIISFVRLVAMPIIFIAIASFFEIPKTIYICAISSLAMPLGLNTIVIPSALGKDSSVAASMAVISHLLSGITIPLLFAFIK